MRILGIDPGLAQLGYGIIDIDEEENKITNIEEFSSVRTEANTETGSRLKVIKNEIEVILDEKEPDYAAVEQIFSFINKKTIVSIGQVMGVIALVFHNRSMEFEYYTPLQAKQTVTGNGRAKKAEVQEGVKKILNMEETPRPNHAADALAIALCHSDKSDLINLEVEDE